MTFRPDSATLDAYTRDAARYSREWLDQPPPDDMYALWHDHLLPMGKTADIGCGNGRDTAWLADNGYRVTGFDASEGLLEEARRLYPHIAFRTATLPSLAEIDEQFDNVVCETVLMHLAPDAITDAVDNLVRILRPSGMLYLSWRVTEGEDRRQPDGRLYSAFEPGLVTNALSACVILFADDTTSASSGKRVCRIIAARRTEGTGG
ncbi:Type 11 methyltransferase [Paraburkholderia piptadeniae]|uniref:Type 11 methyltransferase n=1 Tax=Paraburkholderia piptadeniae TaxID=1701573 RepID=A0A1N7SRB7_9BURK|nr:class I SAM-dependent methyltransferase [Paraburkholderia piptadeniae]SIT49947.1 Type 11 methyltransferase [Paraburkholderia piptadeniae]